MHGRLGALTIGLSCVSNSALGAAAEIAISPVTGAEVLTGSTRLKAGTATKLVLNMLSTGVMVRTGYVYGNLMVNMQTTNAKLVDRAARIVSAIAGLDRESAGALLDEAGSVKTAVVMAKLGLSHEAAEAQQSNCFVLTESSQGAWRIVTAEFVGPLLHLRKIS